MPLRGLPPHRDGVGVLEAERRQPADAPAPAELAATRGRTPRAGRGCGGSPQDREQAGAGVLGIDVDRARAERAERDLGGAEPGPALHRDAARLEQLREHLGEEVRLAERLGRDDDRAAGGAAWTREQQQRAPRAAISATPRALEQLAHVRRGGRGAQLVGGADLLDAPGAQHGDPVGQEEGLGEVVGDEQRR